MRCRGRWGAQVPWEYPVRSHSPPGEPSPQQPRKEIGFHIKEDEQGCRGWAKKKTVRQLD